MKHVRMLVRVLARKLGVSAGRSRQHEARVHVVCVYGSHVLLDTHVSQ